MMYLVTPAIYEKLLLCIDEGDKKLLDSLNKPREETQDKRPAQVVIDALSNQEIKQEPSFHDESSLPYHSFDQTSMNVSKAENVDPVVVPQPPIVVQQPPQQPVPVAVTVLPQVDNPVPQSGGPIAVADTSLNPPPIIVTSVPGPPPPPPPPPAISAMYPPKPVHISVPTNITRPAVLTQPIRQPAVLNQSIRQPRSSSPIFDTAPLPEDYDDWDELEPIRPPKRRVNESFINPTGKRLRVNEFDDDAFHVRDDRYRQRMLERARNRRMQTQPPIFTNNPLPRDPVQWQPLQCIPTTTGGQICNPDPVQPPVIAASKKRSRSESPGHEPPPQRLRMSRSGPSVCPICGIKLGDNELLKLHIKLKHLIKVKKEKKKRFTSPGIEPRPEPFVYNPSEDAKFRIKRRFADSGSETPPEPFVYDPALDTPFRRPKPLKADKPGPTRQRIKKPNQYRCPMCKATLSNLSLFKDHVASKHNRNPDEVIREMASTMLANPQPGGSRDFYNWTNLRLQPPRPTERRRRFGQLNKSTQDFDKWK